MVPFNRYPDEMFASRAAAETELSLPVSLEDQNGAGGSIAKLRRPGYFPSLRQPGRLGETLGFASPPRGGFALVGTDEATGSLRTRAAAVNRSRD